jgi:hypothetical protein
MATSYNGWYAAPGWSVKGGQLEPLVIAGESFAPGVLAGDVHDVFEYVLNRVHREVEPVYAPGWHTQDDWGYSFRPNTNNPSELSCHASATAADYNATRHPNGRSGTWTAAQKAQILRILADVDNAIRVLWGYDEMHFEVCVTPSSGRLQAVAKRLRGNCPTGDVVRDTQLAVNLSGASVDGAWGDETDNRVNLIRFAINRHWPLGVRDTQLCVGTEPDGVWGDASQEALAQTVRKLQTAWGATSDGLWGPGTEKAYQAARNKYYKK